MIRYIALAALAVLLNVTSALSQPVLTNGGFEQNPPNNYGNNIPWPIAPWVLTAGSANVVTVDGPGGATWYGSLGPASDATGGTGNQHYLDQANTVGTIYQEFTPLCTGDVRFGAYFSTRDNLSGTAQVSITDATGANIIAGPASVSLPAGDSENDPWQLSAFTATLTAGTTYRFQIFMDNNLNMDNAYVAFGPECTEHTSPDWSNEDTNPDPEPAQCSPFTQQEAICNTTTGLYEVSITNSMSGLFSPTEINLSTTAPGVTITQNPFDQLTLLVSGATPGQVIPVSTTAISYGAGAGDGLDLCCNGEMSISIPEGDICEIIDEPAGGHDETVDLSIEKTWHDVIDSQVEAGELPHGFEVIVDLEMGALTPGAVITVDDPASGQINVTAFGSPIAPAGWTCSTTAGSWSCQYVVPPSGAILPATIVYPAIIDGSSHVLNCAAVSAVSAEGLDLDTNVANNDSCWEVNAPDPGDQADKTGVLSVEKICTQQPSLGNNVVFVCDITVSATAPVVGTVDLTDDFIHDGFNGDQNALVGQLNSTDPWTCSTAPYSISNTPQCSISSDEFAAMGGTATFTTNVTVATGDMGEGVQNCASVSIAGQELDRSCVDLTVSNPVACVPSPEIAGDEIDNDCDGEVDEPIALQQINVAPPNLSLAKSPVGECRVNVQSQTYSCGFTLTVENTGPDAFSGPLHLLDTFGSPSPRDVNTVTADGWECFTADTEDQVSCFVAEIMLPPAQDTTIEMSLTLPGVRNGSSFENCVSFARPENSVLQTKIMQTLLNSLGIDVGSVDGIVGPKTRAGIIQLQRQEGWPETGEMSDQLLQAMGLNIPVGDQICATVTLPPMPEPPLSCDPSTTVLLDGSCECRFSRMMQINRTSCACIQGTQLEAGRGCFRPERQISEPRRPSAPSSASTPTCPPGSTFNAARGVCIAPAPREACSIANQVMVNGTCRCRAGFELRSGGCREERSGH